jgi:predicted DCC family thiol-disulfide oxidoreductase YuxK
MDNNEPNPIVIYDGECRLCRNAVKFMRAENSPAGIRFVQSSDPLAMKVLDSFKIPRETSERTVILIEKNFTYIKSTAILKALMKKSFLWRTAGVLFLVPAFIRDAIYDWIAKRRK